MKLLATWLSVAFAGATSSAQQTVDLPASASTRDAWSEIGTLLPSSSFRCQQILALGSLNAQRITLDGMAWRTDAGLATSFGTVAGGTLFGVTVRASWAGVSPLSPTENFATNTGGYLQTILFQGDVALPSVSIGVPYWIPIAFQTPFVLDTSVTNDIVLEITATGSSLGWQTYFLDAESTVGFPGWVRPAGLPGALRLDANAFHDPYRGSGFGFSVCGAPWGVLLLGTSMTRAGNLALPLDLTPFGAFGESLQVSPDVVLGLGASYTPHGSGICRWRGGTGFSIPPAPELAGQAMYAQALTTSMPLMTTTPVEIRFPIEPRFRSAFVAATGSTTAASGTVYSVAPVIRLRGTFQ